MKGNILDISGKKTKQIDLPSCFSARIREDIVSKFLEASKRKQPYGPSPLAGNQSSASGKIKHRRHVWKTHYGKGMSRIPRKTMTRKGSQFNWVGATIPSARGGRRAHPPKVISMLNRLKINKKEIILAIKSALSATANGNIISEKYFRINQEVKGVPFIVESGIIKLKTKELMKSVKDILGKDLFEIIKKNKTIRSGKGKLRGRKYKSNAGLLMILGKNEKLKTKSFDIKNSENISINDLAKGGLGRLTLYTEQAIKDIGEKFK